MESIVTLTPQDAELVADAVLARSEALVDAIVKRLAARERLHAHAKQAPENLTYAQTGERLGCSTNAIKMMVYRKILKAHHPCGGRRAYITSVEIDRYMNSHRSPHS
jgi:hypothetical protein